MLGAALLAQRWFERRAIPWPARFDQVTQSAPLDTFIASAPASGSASSMKETGPALEAHRRPGPKPALRERIIAEMLSALCSGGRTSEGLAKDKLEALAREYGCSPNTAKAVRAEAMKRFAELQK